MSAKGLETLLAGKQNPQAPFPVFVPETATLLRTAFSEKVVLVPVISFGQARGSAVLDSFMELSGTQSSFKTYSDAEALVASTQPIVLEGRTVLVMEVKGWGEDLLQAGLLVASIVVINLDGFNSVAKAEQLLRLWRDLKEVSPTEKVLLMMDESQAWKADCLIRRFSDSDADMIRANSQVLVYRDEVEAGSRLQALLSTLRLTYIRSADVFLRGLDSFPDRYTEAIKPLTRNRISRKPEETELFQQEAKKLEAQVESIFQSATSRSASLFPVFSSAIHASDLLSAVPQPLKALLQHHLNQLIGTYQGRCSEVERDCLYLLERRLFDLTGELVLLASYPLGRSAEELEARLGAVLHHFPETEGKLGKLHSTLVSLKNSQQRQLEQSKFYLRLGALSIAALAFSFFSDDYIRMFFVSTGLCGLLSVLVLRSTANKKGPEVALSQAADFLISPTQMGLSGHIQRLFASLSEEEPLIVTLLVGVKNSAVLALANALARQAYPFAMVSRVAFEKSQCSQILSCNFVSDGKVHKGLIVAINFEGRNDTQEYRFLLKLAIALFTSSSKIVLLHSGADLGGVAEVRQDSTLKNIIEMSLMMADETYREYLLVAAQTTPACLQVKQSFEAWRAAVNLVSGVSLEALAATLAEELPHSPKISKGEVASQVAKALTGL